MNHDLPLVRIVVVGTSCSGKTTFASRIASSLNIPHIELDKHHWLPDWQERPDEEFLALLEHDTNRGSWVADGNYAVARELLWGRSTDVVWLKYSFPLVFWRALKRTLRRSFLGEPFVHGNRETIRHSFFSRESILWWVITTHGRRFRQYPALLARYEQTGKTVHILSSPAEAEQFLRRLETSSAGFSRVT